MTRALVFSTLFPNEEQPNHGVFVLNRLRETLALGGLDATVLAPIPYFPFKAPAFGRYATFARAPRAETRDGLEVRHPRYLVLPKIGSVLTPRFLYRAALAEARRLAARGIKFDVIDAHYFYPDGVAAALLGRALRKPVVITGRGTDLTLIPQAAGPRAQIQWAAREASAMVTVCEDLRQRLIKLGAQPDRVITLRNGVDLDLFAPRDREAARVALGLEGYTLLCVGALIPRKGQRLVIEAVAQRPGLALLIVGDGPMREALQALAEQLGVASRVRFLGETPHRALPDIYSAVDALVLASEREGWANVLLEAMACGAPVIASDVNGSAEVVGAPEAGRLLAARTPAAIVAAVDDLQRNPPARAATRRYAERFGWRPVAEANKVLLLGVAQNGYDGRYDDKILNQIRVGLASAEEGRG